MGPRQHEQAAEALGGTVRDVGWRPSKLLESATRVSAGRRQRQFDLLIIRDTVGWAHELNPPAIVAGCDAVYLVERIIAVLSLPQVARKRVERQSEAVA